MMTIPPPLKFNLDLLATALPYSIHLHVVDIVLLNSHVHFSAVNYKVVKKHARLQ